MRVRLVAIPELDLRTNSQWKIHALEIDGKSPTLAALVQWSRKYPHDYKKILVAMRLVSDNERVADPKYVKKAKNPGTHGPIYEMRAHRGIARLFFFYDTEHGSVVVCTNAFSKGKGDQDAAFEKCGKLKQVYLNEYYPDRK